MSEDFGGDGSSQQLWIWWAGQRVGPFRRGELLSLALAGEFERTALVLERGAAPCVLWRWMEAQLGTGEGSVAVDGGGRGLEAAGRASAGGERGAGREFAARAGEREGAAAVERGRTDGLRVGAGKRREWVLWERRMALRARLWLWLAMWLVAGLCAGVALGWLRVDVLWCLLGLLLVACGLLWHLCASAECFVLTQRRLMRRYGLFLRSSEEMLIADVRAVNVRRPGLVGLLGVGSVEFRSAREGSLVFAKVGGVTRLERLVREAVEQQQG